jgi:putative sporulation protein YtaF
MALGKLLLKVIPENIENSLGSIILLLIGLWSILKPLLKGSDSGSILENPEKVDIDKSSVIDAKESVILALALTVNNIGIGIGASITGLNIAVTSLLTFAASIIMITVGYFIGSRYLSRVVNKRTAIISGLLIIILAVYELLI